MKSHIRTNPHVIALACLALTACSVPPPKAPNPIIFDSIADGRTSGTIGNQPQAQPRATQISAGPKPPPPITGNLRPTQPKTQPSEEAGDLTVSVEQMSLPAFIQAIYGGILQLNYSVDAAVNARTDLITFRTPKPISGARLTELSAQLLKSYGIAVQDFGGVLRIVPSTSIASTLPLVRRGRAQPTVPQPLRPIFQYIETEAVRPQSLLAPLKSILGDKVKVEADNSGGLLLSGQPDDVQIALELVQVFDQPMLRGQHSSRIVPRFWSAEEFVRRLGEVLKAEGYNVGNQGTGDPVTLIALPPVNSVIAFAGSPQVLKHILDWVRDLDQLNVAQAGSAFFTYPVKHSDAQDLAKALNELISGANATPSQQAGAVPAGAAGTTAAAAPALGNRQQRRVVVNGATNSLIFQGGSQEDYRQWLTLLSELDRPVKSALIDVLVAEVALNDDSNLGFSWKLQQLGSGAQAVRLSGTTYDLNASGSGLAVNALLGGNPLRQLAINALASNSDSRVISNPKVVTRNGEAANISVGQDVPTVSSQAVTTGSAIIGNNSTVVPQTIQYRNTGVLLRVRPVIHAGDRIDLEVSQEVSSAETTTTGVTTSPTIRKRSVETKLSLRDGATVMLGGLISETNTQSDSGVPLLKDIPVLGSLFKSATKSRTRTELVMLITPYVLNDVEDAQAATDSYQDTLGAWADSVRQRVKASRDARIAANQRKAGMEAASEAARGQKTAAQPAPATPVPPTGPTAVTPTADAPASPADAPQEAPADDMDTSSVAPESSLAPGERMINLSDRQQAPVADNPAPSGAPTEANAPQPPGNAQPANAAAGTPVTGKPAPRNIGGTAVPAGSTLVEDPKLIEEILNATRRR
ncbi:hypothetical protein BA022_12095 [Diaphorobacter nitroreducens]|uniref:type II secretion system protein GspD n=1 Tax=Diaphorobacter nitroreducens TaxID=164759 RepID=UPI000B5A1309|nr:secretin N-terminal domain-containing protein [Diaphorobacter nitroreducens]ASI69206.1 hypothetical protein BA022_12095 [Diaphorobacter nitroreducens]